MPAVLGERLEVPAAQPQLSGRLRVLQQLLHGEGEVRGLGRITRHRHRRLLDGTRGGGRDGRRPRRTRRRRR